MKAKLSHSPFRAQELTLMEFPRPGSVLFTFLPSTGGQLHGSYMVMRLLSDLTYLAL